MNFQVSIVNGHYRGETITGVFPVVKAWQEGSRGGFVTIRNPSPKSGHPDVQRISVSKDNCRMLGADGQELSDEAFEAGVVMSGSDKVDYEKVFISSESEADAMDRISSTFSMLNTIVDNCSSGVIRGLVVSGPPGIGKSTGVIMQLEKANTFRKLQGKREAYTVVSGGVSDIGLYQLLYKNSDSEQVIVFDDADDIFLDEGCLNMMKRALDSGSNRRISWHKESRVLQAEGMADSFDFNASVIVLSNIDFEKTIARGSRLASHLEAIMSRCHYLDLEMSSQRDRILRVKQMVRDGLLREYNFTSTEEAILVDFVEQNQDYLREISLRMVKKIADLYKSSPSIWVEMAEATVLTRDAKFKRLLERKVTA